jgi:hypothetical protein
LDDSQLCKEYFCCHVEAWRLFVCSHSKQGGCYSYLDGEVLRR